MSKSPLFDLPTDARAEAVARIMQASEADAAATKAATKAAAKAAGK